MRNRSAPAKKDISIATLFRIQKLFSSKGWPQNGDLDECYFDRFCNLMRNLSEEQQEMLFTLSEEFLWVQETEYIRYFVRSFDLLIKKIGTDTRKTIVLIPLLPPEDFGKAKSSVVLFYFIKGNIVHLQKKYSAQNITLLECPAQFNPHDFSEDSLFCLVDDFVGSGETASSAISFFLENGISKCNMFIIALVSMQQGMDFLRQDGVQVFSSVVMRKAISDRTDGKDASFRPLMESLEAAIKVRSEYTFGYAHSEGLVKMIRTPNNTFPIFWMKNKKNQSPPFPR